MAQRHIGTTVITSSCAAECIHSLLLHPQTHPPTLPQDPQVSPNRPTFLCAEGAGLHCHCCSLQCCARAHHCQHLTLLPFYCRVSPAQLHPWGMCTPSRCATASSLLYVPSMRNVSLVVRTWGRAAARKSSGNFCKPEKASTTDK